MQDIRPYKAKDEYIQRNENQKNAFSTDAVTGRSPPSQNDQILNSIILDLMEADSGNFKVVSAMIFESKL